MIRVCEARGITPPAEITLPAAQQVAIHHPGRNRDSLSRKQQNWWLPYVVLEFDKNEVLIDSLGGDTGNPIYQYRANLYVVFEQKTLYISIYTDIHLRLL